jgi:hypothetical protein
MSRRDFATGMARLQRAHKRLMDRWQQTCQEWDDVMSRDFERQYLAPLKPQTQLALAAIQRMAEVFDVLEKECEDDFAQP